MMIRYGFFALALCLGLVSAAHAATYNVAYDGSTLDFSAQIITDGSGLVTSITGLVNGGDPITGIVPTGTNGSWLYNNLFGVTAEWVDWYGLLFATAGGITANFFHDAGNAQYVVSFTPGLPSDYWVGSLGPSASALSVAQVPLPTAGLLLLGGLGALGAIKRLRRQTA